MATPAILSESDATARRIPRMAARLHSLWLHALLLAVTLVSTTVVGMRYMANFRAGRAPVATAQDLLPYGWALAHASKAAEGLPFSLTLLAILLTHELGHLLAARAHRMRASLPFVLPAPSISGTAGAMIRIGDAPSSRAALLSLGAFGPVLGFLVAAGACAAGLRLSAPAPWPAQSFLHFQPPLLLLLLARWVRPEAAAGGLAWHPVLLAAWIGMLVTSLNLLPAGQFDGGHVLYAFAPRAHRWFTWLTVAVLLALGVRYWAGWILWAVPLLLPGMRHPGSVGRAPLPRRLALLGPACLAILVLCFTPRPFDGASLLELFGKASGH